MDIFPIDVAIATFFFSICSTSIILVNLLLIKPILKKDKSSSPVKIASIYLLIGGILACCGLGLVFFYDILVYYYKIYDYHYYYKMFHPILYPFVLLPIELSAFNLMVYSFIVLTNNHFLLSKKKVTILIFTLITWLPPVLFLYLHVIKSQLI